jgi:hypothetical protein
MYSLDGNASHLADGKSRQSFVGPGDRLGHRSDSNGLECDGAGCRSLSFGLARPVRRELRPPNLGEPLRARGRSPEHEPQPENLVLGVADDDFRVGHLINDKAVARPRGRKAAILVVREDWFRGRLDTCWDTGSDATAKSLELLRIAYLGRGTRTVAGRPWCAGFGGDSAERCRWKDLAETQ